MATDKIEILVEAKVRAALREMQKVDKSTDTLEKKSKGLFQTIIPVLLGIGRRTFSSMNQTLEGPSELQIDRLAGNWNIPQLKLRFDLHFFAFEAIGHSPGVPAGAASPVLELTRGNLAAPFVEDCKARGLGPGREIVAFHM